MYNRKSAAFFLLQMAKQKESVNEVFNQKLLKLIEKNYEESGAILGYRQMTIKLNRENDFKINEKRVLRLMRIKNLKSVC